MEDPVYLADEHVLSRMLASETRQEISSYFKTRLQRDFNENDRRELATWMRDVCIAEECQAEIFPLSIMIVDRFLSLVKTKRTQLQLLGSVALLLASKLRQTTQIPAKHLIYYTQDLVTLDELKTWELFVLTTLKWDVALVTPVDYLDIFIRRVQVTHDQVIKHISESGEQIISDIEEEACRLIAECCLESEYLLWLPSSIAWGCLMRAVETCCDPQLAAAPSPELLIDQQQQQQQQQLIIKRYEAAGDFAADDHEVAFCADLDRPLAAYETEAASN